MALLTVIPIDLPSVFLFQMSRSSLILSQLLDAPSGCTEGMRTISQLIMGRLELGCPGR